MQRIATPTPCCARASSGSRALESIESEVQPGGACDAGQVGVPGAADALGADACNALLGDREIDVVERDQDGVRLTLRRGQQRRGAREQPVDPRT